MVQIVLGQILLLQQGNIDGRSADERRELVLFECLQHVGGDIPRHGDHSCGHPCGQQQCNRQTEHMEQRQQGQKHMFLFRGLLNDRHQLGKVGQ